MFPAVEAGEFIELKEREVCEIEVMIAEESGTCGYALFAEYVEAAGAGRETRYELFRTGVELPQADGTLPFHEDSHEWEGVTDD